MVSCSAVVVTTRRQPLAIVLAVAVLAALAGCGGGDEQGGSDGKVAVAASFYPLAEAAERIGGDRVAVTDLTPVGGQPHDLQPASPALAALRRARVVISAGGGFQPAVAKAVAALPPTTIRVDGNAGQTLMPAPRAISGTRGTLEGVSAADGQDPHTWLDPERFLAIAKAIQAALIRADPDHRAEYETRGKAYAAELTGLVGALDAGLSGCDTNNAVVIVTHPAYAYLLGRYDLRQAVTAGLSAAAQPDPRSLAAIARYVKRTNSHAIFFSAPVPSRLATSVKAATGADSKVLNPVEGLTQDEIDRGDSYISVMRQNLATLREGLSCQSSGT